MAKTPNIKPTLKGSRKEKAKAKVVAPKQTISKITISAPDVAEKSNAESKKTKRPTSTLKPRGEKVPKVPKPHELQRFIPDPKATGRPTSITLEVLSSMKDYFLLGCTIEEAARASGITKQTFYNYTDGMDEELRNDFLDLVEGWRDDTVIKARRTIVDSLNDPESAKWYLARKRKDEFATRTQNDVREVDDFADLDDDDLKKIANAADKAASRL